MNSDCQIHLFFYSSVILFFKYQINEKLPVVVAAGNVESHSVVQHFGNSAVVVVLVVDQLPYRFVVEVVAILER